MADLPSEAKVGLPLLPLNSSPPMHAAVIYQHACYRCVTGQDGGIYPELFMIRRYL